MQGRFFKVSFFRVEVFVHTIFLFLFSLSARRHTCQSYLITFSHFINQIKLFSYLFHCHRHTNPVLLQYHGYSNKNL